MTRRVELFPSEAYFRFLETVAEGNQAFTHAALIRVGIQTRRYYIKCYQHAAKPLFNEISGFLLAAEAGVPQADSAALIALPGQFMEKIYPSKGFSTQQHWLCWCTSAVASANATHRPSATTYFNCDFSAIADDLRIWKELPLLLAFDEWVANIDRNTGNLIRLSAGDYAVIDHGAILTGPDWIGDLLAPIASYTNKIWSLLRHFKGIPLPISSGAVHASGRFQNAYQASSPEMWAIGSELLSPDDLNNCVKFLSVRSHDITQYLQSRLGVLV